MAAYDTPHDPDRRAAYDAAPNRRGAPPPTGRRIPVRLTHAESISNRQGPITVPDLTDAPLRAGPVRIQPSIPSDSFASAGPLDRFVQWLWEVEHGSDR
ncbi:hypothetical protein NGB36_24985 [Streptomyces sp. RB6PN25]|uniref:Uncharacterized protein n=1 Tax=Streptomyces humicola TaxID=2953240 RepID=A0ABT1Q1F3_9ACTN|nr:hypothetical protein [Streptomyces humicola]MCQ4083759.1 hypothetical protein [Streptomyces humicola]